MDTPGFNRPKRAPDIEAEIFALPTNQGGRSTPMFSGYRPNHNFGVEGMLNDATHEYSENGLLTPGESGKANMWVHVPEYQKGRLFIGMEFTVQEGGRLVGTGKITKVFNESLLKST